ncbi:transcription initiation factor TFIIH subunit 3 [Nematocida displodere]|uniref:General transcription and DNA repair factor IIH subunit TFB4 n=1 Tax=Nematocida displodere TaxID=1805483 RepID=A0A177EAA2_9MICR|nr:transcription initiation factor TFIIH subunit 3 [Nematocida displodere]
MLLVLVVSSAFPASAAILNDLLIFIRIFTRISQSHRIVLLQNLKVCYDSSTEIEESLPSRLEAVFNSEAKANFSKDFGYALLLLSKARQKQSTDGVLLFSSPEAPSNFIKCAFTAKKLNVSVDCIIAKDSVLAEISSIMKGTVHSISNSETSLLEYLISTISLNPNLSKRYESTAKTCICHQTTIEKGYLCPICLGLYCKFIPICRHCKTKFVF